MKEYDRKRWPGGAMCGYVLWARLAWCEWCNITSTDINNIGDDDQINFDKWLKVSQQAPIT